MASLSTSELLDALRERTQHVEHITTEGTPENVASHAEICIRELDSDYCQLQDELRQIDRRKEAIRKRMETNRSMRSVLAVFSPNMAGHAKPLTDINILQHSRRNAELGNGKTQPTQHSTTIPQDAALQPQTKDGTRTQPDPVGNSMEATSLTRFGTSVVGENTRALLDRPASIMGTKRVYLETDDAALSPDRSQTTGVVHVDVESSDNTMGRIRRCSSMARSSLSSFSSPFVEGEPVSSSSSQIVDGEMAAQDDLMSSREYVLTSKRDGRFIRFMDGTRPVAVCRIPSELREHAINAIEEHWSVDRRRKLKLGDKVCMHTKARRLVFSTRDPGAKDYACQNCVESKKLCIWNTDRGWQVRSYAGNQPPIWKE